MPRSRLLIAGFALVLAVSVGGYVAYDQVLSGDSVAPLTLPSTSPEAVPTDAAASAATGTSSEPAADDADGDVAGVWTVAGDTQAGYRVRERLASLSAESDAVGRTSDVTGSITLESDGTTTTLASGTLTVDTTTITSDEDRRDSRLRSEGLETDIFPTASFTITQPVEIPASAIEGAATDVTLVGDLELHGVTKSVSIPAQARLVDGTIQVAGSITFLLSDFEIEAPNVGGFIISIADEGALEFQVNFTRA
ncbi:MAG: YceI family protein [Chloroflexota bacterium]